MSCSSAATARPRRRAPLQTELLPDLDCELRDPARVLARGGVLDRQTGEQARDPGAEQLLLLGHDVAHVDLRVQRARGRGTGEVAHERGRDDQEGAQLEHVPAPEADRPDRAEQVRGDCDGEPHEPGRHGQVAEPPRELERPQCAQREHAVDQRVRADDPPDERAQGDRDARDRSRDEQRERCERDHDGHDADLQRHEVAHVPELARSREQCRQQHRAAERHRERARDADRGRVLPLDQEAGRRQAVHGEQRGHDREARADGGGAPVVPARAQHPERQRPVPRTGARSPRPRRSARRGPRTRHGCAPGAAVRRARGLWRRRRRLRRAGLRGSWTTYRQAPGRLEAPWGCAAPLPYTPARRTTNEGSLADGGRHGVHLGVRDRRPPRQDRRPDLGFGSGCGAEPGSARTGGVRDAAHDRPRPGRRGDLHDCDARRAADRARRRPRDRLHELRVRLRRRHLRRHGCARQAVSRHRTGRRFGSGGVRWRCARSHRRGRPGDDVRLRLRRDAPADAAAAHARARHHAPPGHRPPRRHGARAAARRQGAGHRALPARLGGRARARLRRARRRLLPAPARDGHARAASRDRGARRAPLDSRRAARRHDAAPPGLRAREPDRASSRSAGRWATRD